VFIKLWAHGISSAEEEEATLGPGFDRTLTSLEQRYNDGTRYALHYITAREAYNLAMAAARGATGPPEQYLNGDIKPYVAGSGCTGQRADAAVLSPKLAERPQRSGS